MYGAVRIFRGWWWWTYSFRTNTNTNTSLPSNNNGIKRNGRIIVARSGRRRIGHGSSSSVQWWPLILFIVVAVRYHRRCGSRGSARGKPRQKIRHLLLLHHFDVAARRCFSFACKYTMLCGLSNTRLYFFFRAYFFAPYCW